MPSRSMSYVRLCGFLNFVSLLYSPNFFFIETIIKQHTLVHKIVQHTFELEIKVGKAKGRIPIILVPQKV